LFIQAAPGVDPLAEQNVVGGSDWHEVEPVEFYRRLVAHLEHAPEREEAYLQAMEETLAQWERIASS